MTRPIPCARAGLALVTLTLLATGGAIFAGPLDPPAGPVTSTGKPLSEMRPGIAINAVNTPGDATCKFKITQPGFYYFTGNILGDTGTHGIKIALGPSGGHVSIDMMGFTLRGVPGSLNGFQLPVDPEVTWDIHGNGAITEWGGWGINGGGSGRLADLRVMVPADGCTNLTAGGNRTTTIENCIFRSTSGPALVTDSTVTCAIRSTVIEGEGCNTTNITYHGGPVMMSGVSVRTRNSTFSGPVIDIGPSATFTSTNCSFAGESCQAPSALRISPGPGAAVVLNDRWDWGPGGFTTAFIDIARDGTQLRNFRVNADATTSAPAVLRVTASNCVLGAIGEGASDTGCIFLLAPSVPYGVDSTGSNNTISGLHVVTAGTGIRLTGAGNTVTASRISGSGTGSIIGVLIALGSTNNLVIRNEFVSVVGGSAVSNLGGSSNGVAPIVTPGNLGSAANPYSNIQH